MKNVSAIPNFPINVMKQKELRNKIKNTHLLDKIISKYSDEVLKAPNGNTFPAKEGSSTLELSAEEKEFLMR